MSSFLHEWGLHYHAFWKNTFGSNLFSKRKWRSSSRDVFPIKNPLSSAQMIVPMPIPLNTPNPKKAKDSAIDTIVLMQSYEVLTLLMLKENLCAISLMISSYASGEMYVWKNSDTAKEQNAVPITNHNTLSAIISFGMKDTTYIAPSSIVPYSSAVTNENRYDHRNRFKIMTSSTIMSPCTQYSAMPKENHGSSCDSFRWRI